MSVVEKGTSNYIDIERLTSDDFSPQTHANSLILSTNNPSDPSIDLTTPLSRVLFDLQEIDSHIHTVSSRHAIDILTYTKEQNEAASRILERVEEERVRLHISYQRLQKEVLGRYEKATEAKINAERSWQLLKLGRQVQRICTIARQYETSLTDSGLGSAKSGKEDYRLLVSCTYTTLAFREIISGVDGPDLGRVELVKVLRGRVFEDGDVKLLDYARRVIREFSMSSLMAPNVTSPTYRETEDSRARFSAATHAVSPFSSTAD
jgi:hypothetical protein